VAKDHIHILGGGPAGASSALAALSEGALVRVIERPSVIANPFRHKVCGEFFSPEIEPELSRLGVWDSFREAGPARVRRMTLHFGTKSKSASLPEPAWGLSRYNFDALLLNQATSAGAELTSSQETRIDIDATGRRSSPSVRGKRLFGFKAHFEGPVDDAVELFFFGGCYVGINAIEGGRTNVCGLGPEEELARFDFQYDALAEQCPALRKRLGPLTRVTHWVSTGPLQFEQKFRETARAEPARYRAGDALSFVDPFTGSGLLAAVRSGAMAGRAAAERQAPEHYLAQARNDLQKPFQIASILRWLVAAGWAERLVPAIPAQLLFSLTRPR
jgi:flavin-dependent dehydrogenase